jgi:hypothetical protein
MRRGGPSCACMAQADAGLRAEVGDRLALVRRTQELCAVVDGPVDQLAAGIFIHPGIAFILHAEQTVEIARHHPVSIDHLAHDYYQTRQVAAQHHGQRGGAQSRPPSG